MGLTLGEILKVKKGGPIRPPPLEGFPNTQFLNNFRPKEDLQIKGVC